MARALGLLLGALLLGGCDSDSDRACQDVGNCSHGGSDDWITGCQEQNDALSDEAEAIGCQAEFDAYFACAEDHFECTGNQSTFPGCEAQLTSFSSCLDSKTDGTACSALDAELSECQPTRRADAAPTPCTPSADCSARCYTGELRDVCAPTAEELARFAECATRCVF